MAVTPMKLVTIVGPLQEFDNVVRGCIINRDFHPESAAQVMRKVKFLHAFDQSNPFTELLRKAEQLSEVGGIKLGYRDFEDVKLDSTELAQFFEQSQQRFTQLLDERESLKRSIIENEQVAIQLTHLGDINVNLQDFFSVRFVKFRFGRMPRDIYNDFLPHLLERKDVYFFATSMEKDYVYGMYLTPGQMQERIDALFLSLQFERIRISDHAYGTSSEAAERLHRENEQSSARITAIAGELDALRVEIEQQFLPYYSYVRYMNDSYNLRGYAAHTEESFYMLGWVPAAQHDAFVQQLETYPHANLVVVSDSAEKIRDYTPPIKLKNTRLVRPFEPFVEMYGLPEYNETDPTALMCLTYTFIFGMMFGDAGQGAVLALGGWLLWKLKKMWLGKIVSYAGLSAVCFGLFYGSIFGFEFDHLLPDPLHLSVLHQSNTVLRAGLYMGVALLSVCIIVNMWNGIRQKSLVKLLFGHNGLAGLIFYLALMAFFLPIVGFGEPLLSAGAFFAIIAVPLVVIFLREPLARWVQRTKQEQKHPVGGFIVENLFEMLEIILSYITNSLSFLRVGAYAISHASLMGAIFSMAGESKNLVIIIIGNLIVMCLEGLLVGIQVLRLEFYEFFSRFYSGGGKPYKPVFIDYKSRKE